MAQIWSADARSTEFTAVVPANTPTEILATVAQPVPYQTAKGVVHSSCNVSYAAGGSFVNATLKRNPNAENLTIGVYSANVAVGGDLLILSIDGTDEIPDGRDVSYALILESDAASVGSIFATIAAMLLSG